ncbi:MAG: hypothetical protein R3D98_04765 [Candidatus Krumholzibacteriia bacterium]
MACSTALGSGPQPGLQFPPTLLLPRGHPTRPPQGRVGEVQDEAGVLLDGDQVLEGEELAELEGFEAVGDDVIWRGRLPEQVSMEEEAVASESGELVVDGGRGAAEARAIWRLAMPLVVSLKIQGRRSGRLSRRWS